MLSSFAEILGELFPAVDPETKAKFARAIKEHRPIAKELYAPVPPSGICQGDVIHSVPIRSLEEDEHWYEYECPCLVLSNTCDAANEPYVTVAACFSYADFSTDQDLSLKPNFLKSVRINEVTNFFFLPSVPGYGDLVVDLGLTGAISRPWLEQQIKTGHRKRLSALSQFGYYLFCAKLTIHLLRPETTEISRGIKVPTLWDRIVESVSVLKGKR